MADEKAEIQKIKSERTQNAASGAVEGEPAPKKRRRTRKKAEPEPAFKPEQFLDFTTFMLDGVTSTLGTSTRTNQEKVALATATCAVCNKRIPNSEYGEEIVLAFVLLPIGASILFEYLTKQRRDEESTRIDFGAQRDGEVNATPAGTVEQ